MRLILSTVSVVALGLAPAVAVAQSSPGLYQGQTVTPGQWNSFFSGKADLNGLLAEAARARGAESANTTAAAVAQATANGAASAANPIFVGLSRLTSAADGTNAGCASTAGSFATDGTLSWQPSCFGVWQSTGQNTLIYPTRGTPKNTDGTPSSNVYAPVLIQAQASGATAVQGNGMFINLDVVGGAYSNAHGPDGQTNTTGQLISVRQRPDASGNMPPYTWGQNIDLHIAPGSGGIQSYGVEYDVNNFNKDCGPGFGCIAASIFLNGINAYPTLAFIYAGAGTTQGFSGTVTTSGPTVTLASGNAFTPALTRITINGVVYRVNFVDASHMTITSAPPTSITTAVAYSANSAMAHDGILFTGDNQISDNDVMLQTAAYNGVNISGKHNVAFNTTGDTAPFALTASANQNMCLNGFQNCLYYDGSGNLGYATAGRGRVVAVADDGSITSNGLIAAGRAVKLPAYTVSGLPACNSNSQDYEAAVSDASSPTYRGALTGGGTIRTPVYCDGSSWTAH